ncbi:hypothetical protein KSP40_PGU009538 [Platanthera guangdongensis]|uniref:Uncharacterized protein n=1 Tax=Platanthera guangdongensis TaxID=2320717 RepID=A0ABR2LPE7_9ASPA
MEKLSLTAENYGSVRRYFIQSLDDRMLSLDALEKLVWPNPPHQKNLVRGRCPRAPTGDAVPWTPARCPVSGTSAGGCRPRTPAVVGPRDVEGGSHFDSSKLTFDSIMYWRGWLSSLSHEYGAAISGIDNLFIGGALAARSVHTLPSWA